MFHIESKYDELDFAEYDYHWPNYPAFLIQVRGRWSLLRQFWCLCLSPLNILMWSLLMWLINIIKSIWAAYSAAKAAKAAAELPRGQAASDSIRRDGNVIKGELETLPK